MTQDFARLLADMAELHNDYGVEFDISITDAEGPFTANVKECDGTPLASFSSASYDDVIAQLLGYVADVKQAQVARMQ